MCFIKLATEHGLYKDALIPQKKGLFLVKIICAFIQMVLKDAGFHCVRSSHFEELRLSDFRKLLLARKLRGIT